jgi:hypothetical protein
MRGCYVGAQQVSSESRGVLRRVHGLELVPSGSPAQSVAECMDGNHHLSNVHVDCWARHQVTGARSTYPAQMASCFESLQEPPSVSVRFRPRLLRSRSRVGT